MDAKFLQADELGVRLEIVAGLPIWEPHPLYRHQKAVERIRATIRKGETVSGGAACACVHIADVSVSFPDGSLKRPDIAIFCQEPTEEDEAIRSVPEAVIEIVSKGYEAKDLEIGVLSVARGQGHCRFRPLYAAGAARASRPYNSADFAGGDCSGMWVQMRGLRRRNAV